MVTGIFKTTFYFILYPTVVKWKEMEAQVDDKPNGSIEFPLIFNLNYSSCQIISFVRVIHPDSFWKSWQNSLLMLT